MVTTIKTSPAFQVESITVCIPIAQSNGFRHHWTLLVLKNDGINNWKAEHFDSKGFISAWYSLRPISDALFALGCESKKFSCKYLGHQGLLNNNDCGRFVTSYIHAILHDLNPEDLDTTSILDNFQKSEGEQF